ncbi:ABC transporter permease [Actinoallomurus sp. NBC_01490]|jgi:ribose/xylose/arabinose/galactoside ABC-type transport system permease subunit|uniref:ABC transporter permease n=1 Tax=Actinoallomurus sp. NBC_01490 TaxID=2903557 RepID=UPI002E36E881|nr:ABC transporter permease [Actinoallomurus sp. NBC_01490]
MSETSIGRFTSSPRAARGLVAFMPLALLLLLLVVFAVIDPRIAAPVNLRNILLQSAPVALLALSAHVVLLSAGIDLSAGYAVGLSGVVMATRMHAGGDLATSALLGLGAVLAVGAMNGALVGWTRLPPFIATLGTMTIVQGLTLFAAPEGLVVVNSGVLAAIGQGAVLGVPAPILVVAVVSAALWFLMRRTRFGVRTYAYGSDEQASILAGVRRGPQMLGVYLLAAVLVFLTTVMVVAQVPLVQPNLGGISLLLDAVAAAVVGGTSIFGGRGTVGGVLVGALIIGLLTNALQVLGVDPSAIDLFKGVIILGALVIDAGMRALHRRAAGSAA